MIHGPPGTGKSETIVTILEILAKAGLKVLVCAEANNPVDILLTKFSNTATFLNDLSTPGKVLRLGHSALIDSYCKQFTLQYLAKKTAKTKKISNEAAQKSLLKGA